MKAGLANEVGVGEINIFEKLNLNIYKKLETLGEKLNASSIILCSMIPHTSHETIMLHPPPRWGMGAPMPCHASKAYDCLAIILENELALLQYLLIEVTHVQLTHSCDKYHATSRWSYWPCQNPREERFSPGENPPQP